jgi:hypothetical protein
MGWKSHWKSNREISVSLFDTELLLVRKKLVGTRCGFSLIQIRITVFNYCRLTSLRKIGIITTELHAIPIFLTKENNKTLGSPCKLVICHLKSTYVTTIVFVAPGRPVGSNMTTEVYLCVLWQNLGQQPLFLSNLHTRPNIWRYIFYATETASLSDPWISKSDTIIW